MVDNRNVRIYVLKHPDTLEVRYVGKTVRSLSRRLGNHIANAKGNKHNRHLSNWILKILSDNKRPIIELLEECEHSIWQEREKYWISQFQFRPWYWLPHVYNDCKLLRKSLFSHVPDQLHIHPTAP